MFTMPGNRNWVAKVVHHQNSTLFQKLTARLLKIKWCFFQPFSPFCLESLGNTNRVLIFGRCFFYSKRDKDSWSPKMRILPNPNFPPPWKRWAPEKVEAVERSPVEWWWVFVCWRPPLRYMFFLDVLIMVFHETCSCSCEYTHIFGVFPPNYPFVGAP